MRNLFIILFLLPLTLFSEWSVYFRWENVDLRDIKILSPYHLQGGKANIWGKYWREKREIKWEVEGEVKDLSLKPPRIGEEIYLPGFKFLIIPGRWEVDKGEGKWGDLSFSFQGEGRLNPFSYRIKVFFKEISLEDFSSLSPDLTIPPPLQELRGGLSLLLEGKEKSLPRTSIMYDLLKGEWKNIRLNLKWNRDEISVEDFTVEFRKGNLKGKGKVRWIIPNP